MTFSDIVWIISVVVCFLSIFCDGRQAVNNLNELYMCFYVVDAAGVKNV